MTQAYRQNIELKKEIIDVALSLSRETNYDIYYLLSICSGLGLDKAQFYDQLLSAMALLFVSGKIEYSECSYAAGAITTEEHWVLPPTAFDICRAIEEGEVRDPNNPGLTDEELIFRPILSTLLELNILVPVGS
ncbi:hypothetical protein [Rhizosaccharibacter radicis]|uniref:DUF2513 domain-containing protein n=1 Tax=Rhizosaccharibacter radicis TaxID=2782605 RepID=A0ABT1VZ60_9PROT|nr:hypothetical protein [Acetobacteraceae bacterium KSS12]